MKKLILSLFVFSSMIASFAFAAASTGDAVPDGKSADVECDVCHEKEARNIAWPEGSPFKIQEDAKARGRHVQQTAEEKTQDTSPVTN